MNPPSVKGVQSSVTHARVFDLNLKTSVRRFQVLIRAGHEVLKGLCHAIFCYSSLYHFFTNSELTHVNEILSKGWNLTYIANVDDFVALFCYLPLVLD